MKLKKAANCTLIGVPRDRCQNMQGLVPASLLIALLCANANAGFNDDGLIVKTVHGPVRGLQVGGARRWQGVPYAEPPLGALRWKNPIDPSPWSTIKDCTNFDIGCAQNAHSMDVPKNTSEDCLYLEVWAPPPGKYNEPAAVMVFFYGGDFKEGGEGFELYEGKYMASNTNTILVVTDYRVGNLGFLFTPKTDTNVGLMDQRFTLRWVQQNIANFGGDPNKVTIFGQSAGGQSVLFHLSSPESYTAHAFQRAIVESGPLPLTFKDPSAGYLLAEIFGLHLGCDSIEDLACMQSKTTAEVLEAAKKSFVIPLDVGSAIQQWAPIIDGSKEFPQEPLFAFQKGQLVTPPVPFMIGSNRDDGALFSYAIPDGKPLPTWEYVAIVVGLVHDNWIDAVLKFYPANDTDNRPILSLLLTDYAFACPSRAGLRWAEAAPSGNFQDIYLYQFTRVPPFCPWPKHQSYCCDLCCHGDEIAYWGHDSGSPFPWNLTGEDNELSIAISHYWTNFAATGNPNMPDKMPGQTEWPLYRSKTDLSMELNWPLASKTGLKNPACALWDEVGYDHARRHAHLDVSAFVRVARQNPEVRQRVVSAMQRNALA